ncbi:hypothetical protein AAFF_G00302320 [Aldrovandia affinis]|uniref:Pentraxin (PTX) domain-containing protein n=1 Tax=Aldrovandia affinis TaxID=143900 RepID=A0AAD7W0W2_9TELE|nr:hypothetical protein AAFF_G00302320 [Aldrovandia affinis]
MEKLALALVLLITRSQALSEASTGLRGKAFIFPMGSTAFVKLRPPGNKNLTAVTVCLRYFSDLSRDMDMFALITQSHNGFQMYAARSKYHFIWVGDDYVWFYDMPHKQNEWNSFCGTWDSGTGLTQAWVNGRHSTREYLFAGGSLESSYSIILAQKYDAQGFDLRFDAAQSFVGELTDVHMWDSVLSPCEIQSYMKGMNFRKGNVINWQDLEYIPYGNVVVELQLKGGGANQSRSYRDEPHWSGPVSRRTHDCRSVFT